MMALANLARALGGEVIGRQVLAPGPGHSPRDRSLAVRPSFTGPFGFIAHSHCGDDWRACRDYVLDRLGVRHDFCAPQERRPQRQPAAVQDDEARTRRAVELWNEGRDPAGTLVERYLNSRALDLPASVAGQAIRFHPSIPWRDNDGDELRRVPAMLAAFRAIKGDTITGVHRTALTNDGEKIGRKMLGVAAGSAIKLDEDAAVESGLVIGEGIETCLAARMLGFRPVWAMGAVGAITRFSVLAGVESLTILAETDDSGASERAVRACGARWHAAGREVLVVQPKRGGDINDALKERAA